MIITTTAWFLMATAAASTSPLVLDVAPIGASSSMVATAGRTVAPTDRLHSLPTLSWRDARLAPGRVLVKPRSPLDTDAARAAFAAVLADDLGVALTVHRPLALGWLLLVAVDVVTVKDTERLQAAMAAHPLVGATTVDEVARAQRLPDDPLLDFMWHVDAMRLPAAWDRTIGQANSLIGVVDSGIIGHEDLDANFGYGFDFIDDLDLAEDGDRRDGNAFDDSGSTTDFHGTHVAGTIAAVGDNGTGVVGGNWRAGLAVARALGLDGTGLASDIGEAALWLAGGDVPGVQRLSTAERARVINLSLGSESGDCNPFYAEIFAEIERIGAIAVAAAGNEGGPVNSPANCGGVIAVAATGPDDALASYSSFGVEVDIVAPGGEMAGSLEDGVLSATASSLSAFTSGAPYTFLQGTSMATPNVAGVLSLLKELSPGLTRAQAEAVLRATGRSCSGCQGKLLIDAGAAVAFVADGAVVDVPGCDNSCRFANDNECDDGRAGAVSAVCDPGTDCDDCEGGGGGDLPTCSSSNNGCRFADDGECDEPDVCSGGSDGADCGRCASGGGGGGGDGGGGGATCDDDNNGCRYRNDGACDEDAGYCDPGTDGADCGVCTGGTADEAPASACGHLGQATLALWAAPGALLLLLRRRRGTVGRPTSMS